MNSGAVYPITVALCDVMGNNLSSATIVLHATALKKGTSVAGIPASPGNANPNNDFRFEGGADTRDKEKGKEKGGYIFNLSTQGLASGAYSLEFMATGDPVSHSVNFIVR